MKKLLYFATILACLSGLAGCGSDDEGGSVHPVQPGIDTATTKDGPKDWVIISNIKSDVMTITLDEKALPDPASLGDSLAAYVGTECRGVCHPTKSASDGLIRFRLVINACSDDNCIQGDSVQLRYYSVSNRHLHHSEKFLYVPGQNVGDNASGYKPVWVEITK